MPQAIALVALGAFTGGLGAFLAGGSILIGALIGGGLSLISSLLTPRPDIGSLRGDVMTTLRVAISPARWILGRARVGGVLVFYAEPDVRKNGNLLLALVVSEGPCEEIERIWIDGNEIEFERTAGKILPLRTIPDDEEDDENREYRGKIEFVEYFRADGTQGYGLRNFPNLPAGSWTDEHRLQGKSWILINLIQPSYGKKRDPRFWSKVPDITFLVKGLRFTWPGQTTPAWTDSAAAIRYWWLTERRGIPQDAIDRQSVISAHSLCTEEITHVLPPDYSDFNPTSRRYTINGIIHADDDHDRIEAEMDFAWQGYAIERDGVFYFRPGSDRVISGTIDPDHIVSMDGIKPAAALQERINSAQMAIAQSREHDWLGLTLPEIQDADALARDGVYLPQDLGTRPFIVDPIAAGRLMAIQLRRARANATFIYTLRAGDEMEWLSIVPGDWLNINDPENGLIGFQVMVLSVELHPDWSVTFTMIEQPNGVYADTLVLPPLKPRDIREINTRLVPQVEGLTAGAGHTESRDGSFVWFLDVSWEYTPFETRIIVEDISNPGNDLLVSDHRTGDSEARILVDTPSRFRITAIHISNEIYSSIPVTTEVEFSWSGVAVTIPSIISIEQYGSLLQIVAQPITNRAVKALEVRYRVGSEGSSADLPEIDASNWTDALLAGRVFIDPSTGFLPIVAEFVVPASGRYRLYARFQDSLGNYGPIVELGYKIIILPTLDTVSEQAWPLWEGMMQNFYLWNHDEEFRLYLDRDNRDAIMVSEWNYQPFWPFGYPDDLADDFDSYFNNQARWYKREAINMGASTDVDVRYDIEFFHPVITDFPHAVYVAPFQEAITQANKDQVQLVPEGGTLTLRGVQYIQAMVLCTDRETAALHRFAIHVGRLVT